MNRVIAIVGPTAVGKSALALHLAQYFNGEIVSADSRQVYRYMDIGTAKPDAEAQALVQHHLIDIIDPDEDFTLALYQDKSFKAIEDIQQRGKVAFLVGGSGLYVKAVVGGLRVPKVAPDAELRRYLEERATREGNEALYRELHLVDPMAAERIDPRNTRRLIRALEVYRATGKQFSQLQGNEPRFSTMVIGLATSREQLYKRIDSRVDRMIERGFVDEVNGLLDIGYSLNLPSMSGIGYKQIGLYIQGQLDFEEAVQQVKHDTHRLARHQYAWFRPTDHSIRWFDIKNEMVQDVCTLINNYLSGTLSTGASNQLSRVQR
jgi:tRNA dimethylallyltransferase